MRPNNTADLGQTLFQQGMCGDYMHSNINIPGPSLSKKSTLLLLGPNSLFGLFDGGLVRLRVCRGCVNRVIKRWLTTAKEGYAYRRIVLGRF